MTVVDPSPAQVQRALNRGDVTTSPSPQQATAHPNKVAEMLVHGPLPHSGAAKPLAQRPVSGDRATRRYLGRVRAWMVVPVVDFALIVAPLAWRPPQ